MAVQVEYFNLIIPIDKIEEYYPGGFEKYKQDNSRFLYRRIIFDDYIVRDGTMDPMSLKNIVDKWINLGLTFTEKVEDVDKYKDMCVVVDDLSTISYLQCDWLEIIEEGFVKHTSDKSNHKVKYDRFI